MSSVKLTNFTVGKVIDVGFADVNDFAPIDDTDELPFA